MDWLQALILGLIQGLTEFLPVSSSGHLEIGKVILGTDTGSSLMFTVVVHGATVLSTIVVFFKDIVQLIKGLLKFKWNEETIYITKILVSMIPVGILGLFFVEQIEGFFTGNLLLVGSMLLITALLLTFSHFAKSKEKKISFVDSLVIGIAQAMAVMPGISRSGATISTGLLLGNKRVLVAKFSFLMVLLPIIGGNLKDLISGEMAASAGGSILPLVVGFVAAFVSGLLACRWMIKIVKKGKLIYFGAYCFVIGSIAIIYSVV